MTNARESPPKLFRLMVWSSGGRYKDDALSDFEDDYNSAIQKFGKRQAQVWAGAQAFKSVGSGSL